MVISEWENKKRVEKSESASRIAEADSLFLVIFGKGIAFGVHISVPTKLIHLQNESLMLRAVCPFLILCLQATELRLCFDGVLAE